MRNLKLGRNVIMTEKRMYNCPCCGNPTYPVPPKDDIGFICDICWWEYDTFIQSDDELSDQNHGMTLNQAKDNYKKHGISAPQLLKILGRKRHEALSKSILISEVHINEKNYP